MDEVRKSLEEYGIFDKYHVFGSLRADPSGAVEEDDTDDPELYEGSCPVSGQVGMHTDTGVWFRSAGVVVVTAAYDGTCKVNVPDHLKVCYVYKIAKTGADERAYECLQVSDQFMIDMENPLKGVDSTDVHFEEDDFDLV